MINQAAALDQDTNKMFVYFSQLMDKPVIDKNDELAGKIYDIVVKPSEVYPQSSSLIIRKGFPNRKYAVIAWSDILEMDKEEEVRLKIDKPKIIFADKHNNKEELTLRRDILEQQVVDTYNHKVIRVNDIHLIFVDHSLMVAHVDISTRGLFRRLGFEKLVDILVGLINKNSKIWLLIIIGLINFIISIFILNSKTIKIGFYYKVIIGFTFLFLGLITFRVLDKELYKKYKRL